MRGIVYDVSAFAGTHPGGAGMFKRLSGRDATEEFAAVGHSMRAHGMMAKYAVGRSPPALSTAQEEHRTRASLLTLAS